MTHFSRRALTGAALSAAALSLLSAPAMAQDFATDGTFQGSLCVGIDCSFSESFGFDTIRMKENNLRLNFEDTSTSASFPSNDWTIVANDSTNGGGNYLAFQDDNTSRLVFRVDAGAPANALRVESSGNVGMGVADPVVQLHVRDGNTPTLRLEQDGSSGFAAQSFDIAANETNFFVRDVTNGSELPFKIQPGADDNSLVVSDNNDIGMGTLSPEAALHVIRTAAGATELLRLSANGVAYSGYEDTSVTPGDNTGRIWNVQNAGGEFRITTSPGGASEKELSLDADGNLTINGNFISGSTTLTVPDYVFAAEYELRPLAEVQSFITANNHLPDVPSAAQIMRDGLNHSEMQMTLLRKVEELTLYTLDQQEQIDHQDAQIAALLLQTAQD